MRATRLQIQVNELRTKLSILALPLLAAALTLSACDRPAPAHHKHDHVVVNSKTVKVERLHDGRYAYYDDGFWWYYVILMNNQNSASTSSACATSSAGRVSLPAGGTLALPFGRSALAKVAVVFASLPLHAFFGVVLMGGCDKTTPALLMGAASCDLPTIGLSGSSARRAPTECGA